MGDDSLTVKVVFEDPSFISRDDTMNVYTNFFIFEPMVSRNVTSIPMVVQLNTKKKE